jgi:uncharacterized membrane protein
MLITLGYIALIIGVILVILGFTVAPQAQRPGWGVLILGVVLILIGYLLPALHPATTDYDDDGHVGMAPVTQLR